MASLTPSDQWDNVYQLETIDPVQGGSGGTANRPHQNNTNRTERIKETLLDAGIDVQNKTINNPTTTVPSVVRKATDLEIFNGSSVDDVFIDPEQFKRFNGFEDTLTTLKARTPSYSGEIVYLKGRTSNGDGGQGHFVWCVGDYTTQVTTDTLSGIYAPSDADSDGSDGCWIRQQEFVGIISTAYFGDNADGITNDEPAISAALSYAAFIRDSAVSAPIVKLRPNSSYLISTGIVVPYGITLDCQGSYISYTGSGVAITAGDRDDTLNYFTSILNFSIKLNDHDACGLKTVCAAESVYNGYIEGYTTGITNTRTCRGVEINGGDVSSFGNVYSVFCNHTHHGFYITSNGGAGSQPTANLFLNCTAIGDQTLDDASVGWYWDDLGLSGFGDGAKYLNCNAEDCNIGLYFGSGCRGIDFNGRIEISTTATSRTVKFHTNTDRITLSGPGFEAATMGAVAGGIEGFSNGNHFISCDNNGHTRLAGNDSAITSGNPTLAVGYTDIFLKKDADTAIITKADDTGTGRIYMQPGSGSSSHGSYFALHGQSHATNPGSFLCGIGASSGGVFAVTNGLGGTRLVVVDPSAIYPGVDNSLSCGTGSYKWTAVYATNGTIQTSDERKKTDINIIDSCVLDAWNDVDFIQYKWQNDDGKTHFGLIAQQIEKVFKAHGLDATEYGILYYDDENDMYSVSYTECLVLEMALLRSKAK